MKESTDIEALRARLEGTRGREYWRSLEALSETAEFKDFLHREFPQNASEWLDPVGRRGFLKLMGASLALAGVSACTRQPTEELVPYVRQPEELVLGKPLFYATAMPMNGAGVGLLVESHEGRPTKIEGNPDHPTSRGATDIFAQAAILGLYDPDRSQTITNLGEIRPFASFVTAMRQMMAAQQAKQGAGLRLLTETVASPTLAAQIQQLLEAYPQAKWVQWEPYGRDNAREGSRLAFGEYLSPQLSVEKADVILSIDADFLAAGPSGLKHARAFASRRRFDTQGVQPSRLYALETSPTNSGTKADHRLPLRPSEVEAAVRGIAAELGVEGAASGTAPQAAREWIAAVAADLRASQGRSLVVAGDSQPPAVHVLAHAMNQVLGNVGQTVAYTSTSEARPSNQLAGLRELVGEMNAGTVELLVVMGANPVYSAPADLDFAAAMQRVAMRAHLGLYEDETAALSHWHIPEAHFLEAWSDVRADEGTVSIVQPLIAPLYNGKSAHEVIAAISPEGERSAYDLVRAYWAAQRLPGAEPADTPPAAPAPRPSPAAVPAPVVTSPGGSTAPPVPGAAGGPVVEQGPATFVPAPAPSPFESAWKKWLHDGIIPGTAFELRTATLSGTVPAGTTVTAAGDVIDVTFRADPSVHDGRFANNTWLQELPKALTKLTWDNPALIAPTTAARLGVANGDVVELKQGERALRVPVWIAPGHALDTLTLSAGYGRTRAGRAANGIGFNVNVLRTSAALDSTSGVQLVKTGDWYELASTQDHWSLEGRNLVRVATASAFAADPDIFKKMEEEVPKTLTMYPERSTEGYAWGMAIDQNVCTGCNACVVACQAENNVPVVGKAQVLNGREMHWLRVDRYYSGELDNPDTYHQPMPCQQCETAPCEVVCPVAATVHSDEGLNDMVYNRCVGTRYCSNNCPYKVRRFNFLLYQDFETPSYKLQRNPDVTVRSRGVMEKCTYCVQRINHARVSAKVEDRQIRDGEVLTACQSACPTEAIVFGNINDPASQVSKLKSGMRNYSLLAELNTRPRTTYLAIVRNPNTGLEPAAEARTDGEG
jgi:MoCo/4Fe-4S cofactor protein with predicted Tat translocation signal